MALPRDRSAYVQDLSGTWRWAANPTPSNTNPLVRIQTPVGQIDGNARIPLAMPPQKRANSQGM